MKVIFLDIDGVLNSFDNLIVQEKLWGLNNSNKSRDEFGSLFDERCVRWLQYIIEKTGCKIVISSSQRSKGLNKMQLMWKMRNLPGEVIDCTPLGVYSSTGKIYSRGFEIQEWIDINKPEKYCIVDDENDILSHQFFVRTDLRYGLNEETAFSIIKILNEK